MTGLAPKLEAVSRFIGQAVAWLTVAMVILVSIIVLDRYWLSSGSIRMQETVTVMHAAVFMLAAAYTLATGGHVRVDIFYSSMSPRRKALVDITGTILLLMPFCVFLLWSGWDYVATSWVIQESSLETGGLPYPFPSVVKSFIPVTALLLLLQGIAMILKAIPKLSSEEIFTRDRNAS